MKMNLIVVLVLGLAVSAAAQEKRESDLVKGRAGFMAVGGSFYDGLNQVDVDNVKIDKKDPSIIEVHRGGKVYIRVETRIETSPFLDYMVKTITVFNSQFQTDSGLGVGSTLGDIRKKYPEVQAELFMEGYLAIVSELSMHFHLEPPTAPPKGGKKSGLEVNDNWRVAAVTVR